MRAASFGLLWIVSSGCVVDYAVTGDLETAPDDTPAGDDGAPVDGPGGSVTVPGGAGGDDLPEDTALIPVDTAPPGDTSGGDTGSSGGDTADPAPPDDCLNTSSLVYLVDRANADLHLFDPSTLQTTRLGALDCDWVGKPESMAIGRDGTGYVRWSDDLVYEVDLTTLDCTPTAYSPGSFGAFGMGFATDGSGTWRDTLFIANASTLATLDTTTWARSTVAAASTQVELTGNGAGELWAFAPLTSPARLVRLDRASGAVVETVQLPGFPSAANLDTFAFAHWGGEFFLFVRSYGVGESSDVYRVTRQGVMTKEVDRMGLDIVGAGASTCAPTQ